MRQKAKKTQRLVTSFVKKGKTKQTVKKLAKIKKIKNKGVARISEAGRATRWIEGQVGNPAGVDPKRLSIGSILKKLGGDFITVKWFDKKFRGTRLECIMWIQVQKAGMGDKDAINFIAERTEGKVIQPITVPSDEPIHIKIEK